MHIAVRFSRFEETDAVVVSVAHQPRKSLLSQVALNTAAEAARTKREPRHLYPRFSQGYPICRSLAGRATRKASSDDKGAGSESLFQEFTSSGVRHGCTSNRANDSKNAMQRRCRFGWGRLRNQGP